MPVLPQSLTPEKLAVWKRDNPGTTDDDAIRAYINFRSKKEGRDPGQVLLEEYPGLRGQMPPAGAQIGSPGFAGGGVPFEGQPPTSLKDAAVNLGSTAVGATSGMGVPAGLGLGGRLLNMAGRGATVGAGTSAATGENPIEGGLAGGLTTAAGQGLGELATGGKILAKRVWDAATNSFATQGNLVKWSDQYARSTLQGAIQEFPYFTRVLQGAKSYADGLYRLTQAAVSGPRNKTLGEQYLSDAIQRSERIVKTVLGGDEADIVVPTLRRSLMSPKEQLQWDTLMSSASGKLNSPYDTPMSVEKAFDGLKTLTKEAIKAGKSLESKGLWSNVEKVRGELLARVPKDLAAEYVRELAQYGKGLAFLDALEDGFGGNVTHPTKTVFDVNGFLDTLKAKGLAEYFPKMNEVLLKGAESGARETISKGFRARVYKMGESATANIPGHRVMPLGGLGKQAGYTPSNTVTGLSIPGISEMTRDKGTPASYTLE